MTALQLDLNKVRQAGPAAPRARTDRARRRLREARSSLLPRGGSLVWFAALWLGCSVADPAPGDDAPWTGPDFTTAPLIRFVDPLVGTLGLRFAAGSAYPGPALPFAMIHPGPDTRRGGQAADLDHCSGYNYLDDEIIAFSHTRMHGTGAPAYGALGLMPTTAVAFEDLVAGDYGSPFDHRRETAAVGYYGVTLDRDDIGVELTAAEHTALHRYTYPPGQPRLLIVDPTHFIGSLTKNHALSVAIGEDGTVAGSITQGNAWWTTDRDLTTYFVLRADTPVVRAAVWTEAGLAAGTRAQGTEAGMVLEFAPGTAAVVIEVAISFTSIDAARENMAAESSGFDFNGVRARAEATWEALLGTVEVAGGTDLQRRNFYTALYHAHLMPTLFTDVGGTYPGFDGSIHRAQDFRFYSDLSLWDTFRTQFGLVLLTAPQRARDFVRSLEAMTRQAGAVPRWSLGNSDARTMVGDPAALMIAEAYAKGVTDFDAPMLFDALSRQADGPVMSGDRTVGREHIDAYRRLGYVPGEAATSLEYHYADWALGNFAAALGRSEDAKRYWARSENYRKLWDGVTGLLRPRDATGELMEPLDPLRYTVRGPYVEGTAAQWRWYVPFDPGGLVALFGSAEAALEALGSFFANSAATGVRPAGVVAEVEPYYWHGNEPSIHAAYLFGEFGRPDLTQAWVRALLRSQYDAKPEGLPGNDDGGTLSAWYVFSALGLYPVAGGDEYWTTSPVFERGVIHRVAGDIEIRAPGSSATRPFVASVSVDGEALQGRLRHSQLADGALLRFTMTDAGERVPEPRPTDPTPEPDQGACDDTVGNCCSVSTALVELPACVAMGEGGIPACGLDVSVLDGLGIHFAPVCQARAQPAIDGDDSCGVQVFDLGGLLPGAAPLEFAGCCRASTRTCGAMMEAVEIPALNDFRADLGLGCVTAEPFAPGAAPVVCGGG